MKRILVTGANGQVGSELRQLAPRYSKFDFTFVDIDTLDLLNEPAVHAFLKARPFDFIINCAAYTAVDKAETDTALCEQVNADAVRQLAIGARETGARIIHISTDYVFDGNSNVPINETATPRPLSVYGATKLRGEQQLMAELPDSYIIRTAWVYSSFGKNFVKTIGGLTRQKPELSIVADQFGTPTYARDLAIALMTIASAVESETTDEPGIYHYTNEGAITWYDFAVFIRDTIGADCRIKPIKTSEYPTAALRPVFSVLDKTKIKKTFALDIPHWSASLRECLEKLHL